MNTPITTKELYKKLIKLPDLHSVPQLEGDILIWKLYKNAYVQAYCIDNDTCIDIISDSLWLGSLVHWHPDEDDMLEELYSLGKRGNILVIQKTMLATGIFYSGTPEQYPLPDKRKWHWGKKKWNGAKLIYLEQK